MPNVVLSKAENLDDVFSDTNILICGKPPDHESLTHAVHWYKAEAEQLGEALANSLPGGTLDQLLIWLLEKRASLLQIRFPPQEADHV